jgi:hypothetical protein
MDVSFNFSQLPEADYIMSQSANDMIIRIELLSFRNSMSIIHNHDLCYISTPPDNEALKLHTTRGRY